jgi:hypothetical protein
MTSCSAGSPANEIPADSPPSAEASQGGAEAVESPAVDGAAQKDGAKITPPLLRNDQSVADIKGMKTDDAVWGEYITPQEMAVDWVYFESPADLAGLPYDAEYTNNFVVLRVKSAGDIFKTTDLNGASQISGMLQQNSVCEILAGVGFKDIALSGEIEVAQNKAKGDGSANLMREGHVYVSNIGDVDERGKGPRLISDINGLLEVDEKGLIHSHSTEKNWKAYDGVTIEKLWGDIVSWYENEKLFAAKNFIYDDVGVLATGAVKNISAKEEKGKDGDMTTSYIIFSMENVQALAGKTTPEFDMALSYYPDDGATPDIDVKEGDSFLFYAVPNEDLDRKGYGKYDFYSGAESAKLTAEGRFGDPVAKYPDSEEPHAFFSLAKGKTTGELKAYIEEARKFLAGYYR